MAVFDAERREIALYRKFGDAYGYVFYVMRALPFRADSTQSART